MLGIHPYCVPGGIRFPNEILSLIINNLVPDTEEHNDSSRTSLAALRLASQALCSCATPVLFTSIHLTDLYESKSKSTPEPKRIVTLRKGTTKLKEILTTRSDIAASVHTLTLRGHGANFLKGINNTVISDIIYHLPRIRTFIFECNGAHDLDFCKVTENFKSAIETLCRSPNLTTLDVENISAFPITIITDYHNLRCLRLSGVYFDYFNQIDATLSQQPYELESLWFDDEAMMSLTHSDAPNGKINLENMARRIKDLRIDNLFCDHLKLKFGWDIMLQASQSLTTLHLARNYTGGFPKASPTVFPSILDDTQFDLGRFPALRHFKIQIEIRFDDNVTTLGHLSRLLSVSSSTSGIETLEIMIDWFEVKSGGEKDLFSTDAGWSALDEVLSSHEFVSLKKVVLRLCLQKDGSRRHRREGARRMLGDPRKTYRSLAPRNVNALFSKFRALTSTQCTLEIH